jgi:hypothetical protein
VRQHWGFVALYRRRAPADPTPARLDEAILWIGCLVPFVWFSLTPAYARSGLPQLLPAGALAGARLALDVVAAAAAAVLLAIWLRRGGGRFLGPKHALMAVVIAFHAVVFALLDDLLAITATLTIFHNLQYHRIVWQHEAGKGRRPLGASCPISPPACCLARSGTARGCWAPSSRGRGCSGTCLLGLGWGVAFHHYLVDGRIWRVRRSPAVARALDAGAGAREGESR